MKFTTLLSIISSAALALAEADPDNVAVATVVFSDVRGHLQEYMSFAQNNPSFSFPTVLISYFTEITTYTNDDYTTLLTDFPASQLEPIVTELPWYFSRLESELESAYAKGASTSTGSASSSSAVKSSHASSEASSSVSSTTKSSKASSSGSIASDSDSSNATLSIKATSGSSSSAVSSSSSAMGQLDYTAPSIIALFGIFSSVFLL